LPSITATHEFVVQGQYRLFFPFYFLLFIKFLVINKSIEMPKQFISNIRYLEAGILTNSQQLFN